MCVCMYVSLYVCMYVCPSSIEKNVITSIKIKKCLSDVVFTTDLLGLFIFFYDPPKWEYRGLNP